jgi:very-short-patch-repair endonuclease
MSVEQISKVDVLVRGQHGLITTSQAVKVLGPSRKQRWVAERRLVSVQPGVFRMAGAPETWHQSLLAAALAADAVVSHRSAAELWGLTRPAGYVEVSVVPPSQPRLRPPAIAHRILDLPAEEPIERQGLRITDPVRTVIDLGLVLPHWSVGDALSRGLSTRLLSLADVRQLRNALGRKGRNGVGVVRELLEARAAISGTEESLLEKRLLDLLRQADLPAPTLQHEVWAAGRFVARVDAAYVDRQVAIEVDGYEHHTTPGAFQRDRTRQNRLVALGWTVLRFTWEDVTKRPTTVAEAIRQAIDRTPAA